MIWVHDDDVYTPQELVFYDENPHVSVSYGWP